MVQWVPYTGGEKESLQASLNRHRDAVVWKLQGLDDTELRRAMLPSGNTLLGLVKHLATWEYIWICRTPPGMPGTSTSCASLSTAWSAITSVTEA